MIISKLIIKLRRIILKRRTKGAPVEVPLKYYNINTIL